MELDRNELLALLNTKSRPERIALLRSLYRLSQAGLAEVAGVSRPTVTSWENPVLHRDGQGWGHEPGKLARLRMGTYFDLPGYVFTDEWGAEPVRRPPRKRKPKPEPTIRVPAPVPHRVNMGGGK